jgi:hypothetical protein
MTEVTFKDFQKLATRRGHTVDDLVDIFRRDIDEARDFFERVMSGTWRNPATRRMEDRSGVIIPYRSVLDFYFKEKIYLQDSQARPGSLIKAPNRGEST